MIEGIINDAWQAILGLFTFHVSPFWGYAGGALGINLLAGAVAFYFSILRTVAGIILVASVAFLAGNWMGEEQAAPRDIPACECEGQNQPPITFPWPF